MTTTAPVATPTGLEPRDLEELTTTELAALDAWHRAHAGLDGGRPWWPAAVRELPIELRLRLALDADAAASWRELERRQVAASPVYFTQAYGHLQPPTGAAIPFAMWEEQEEVLVAFWHERKVIVLKARQLGLTWLALHYAYWVLAFNPGTPNARVLGLSRHGGAASKLLERARRIRELLPPFLRHDEAPDTRGSKSELELVGRGTMISLAGGPDNARMETATLAILDEFGFIRHAQAGDTLTAVQPTLGAAGQEIILSTGNGRTGDGRAFADEWRKARRGEGQRRPFFLPASIDPVRTEDWRATEEADYESPEAFGAEHPESEEQAFAGEGTISIYPAAELDAAFAIGEELAKVDAGRWYETLLAAEGLELGIDWGDTQTFGSYGVALAELGVYIVDELAMRTTEPAEASELLLDHQAGGLPAPRFVATRADLSPPGTNRTFARVLRERRATAPGRYPEQHVNVPFGVYKEGGGQGRAGVNTVGFLRNRLRAAARLVEQEGWRDRVEELARGVLAIHPRCKTLRRQMEDLERDPKTGKVRKPELDPHNLEAGDHGPDSLVALNFKRAERWTATLPGREPNG